MCNFKYSLGMIHYYFMQRSLTRIYREFRTCFGFNQSLNEVTRRRLYHLIFSSFPTCSGQTLDFPLRAASRQLARVAGVAADHAPARRTSVLRHAGARRRGSSLYPYQNN